MKQVKKPLWRCPKCGREFVFRTREHSCTITTVEEHLAKTTPEMRELYAELERWLEALDGCKITPVKTMIIFSVRASFGGITIQKKALQLNFFLDRVLTHRRLGRVTMMGPNKFCHPTKLQTLADFDDQVRKWLLEAYELARG
jgi:Domain of unknown function (DUF5655)